AAIEEIARGLGHEAAVTVDVRPERERTAQRVHAHGAVDHVLAHDLRGRQLAQALERVVAVAAVVARELRDLIVDRRGVADQWLARAAAALADRALEQAAAARRGDVHAHRARAGGLAE